MAAQVLLDGGAVSRCRRRVHLEHDPVAQDTASAPLDPATEQRIADAAAHRAAIADRLRETVGGNGAWRTIAAELPVRERVRATERALAEGVECISEALLPADRAGGRRGGAELLVRSAQGYVPVLVVRHRITDSGQGARTTALTDLTPDHAVADPTRKARSQPRDQLRLAHLRRLLQAAGYAEADRATGGVIGLDADAVVWHDLDAPTWPGDRSTLAEYDARFADRLAIAHAAATGGEPLAAPSRILECRRCPWWPRCEAELLETRDVSLVVRGADAAQLRTAGIDTVDKLATLDPAGPQPVTLTALSWRNAVTLAKAWLADLNVVRKVPTVEVDRADVEVDVDMESFGDSGAYLWGCWLSGVDVGIRPGYHAFATWDPLPTADEARSFARFWVWLSDVRARAAASGRSFKAYCYNALAENRWLYSSATRFAGRDGVPELATIQSFVESDEWVDLFQAVTEQFLCSRGKGLKVIAPVAGFQWRDAQAGGEASMRWYRDAVGMDGSAPDAAQQQRLLQYNEDDVRATLALREWMSGPATHEVPFIDDL